MQCIAVLLGCLVWFWSAQNVGELTIVQHSCQALSTAQVSQVHERRLGGQVALVRPCSCFGLDTCSDCSKFRSGRPHQGWGFWRRCLGGSGGLRQRFAWSWVVRPCVKVSCSCSRGYLDLTWWPRKQHHDLKEEALRMFAALGLFMALGPAEN